MGIEIPESLQWVAKYVVGAGDWPEGDETAMRRVATAWSDMAAALEDSGDDAQAVMRAALTAIDQGQTHDAMAAYWDKVAGNDESALPKLIEYCNSLSDSLDESALDIEHTKMVIIASMVVLAAELAVAIATAWTGVGAAAGAAAKVATQIGIRMAIRTLIKKIIANVTARAAARAAMKGAAFGVLEGVGTELAPHLIQMAKGDRTGLDEQDVDALWNSAKSGAVGGAVGAGLGTGGLGGPLANRAGSTVGKLAADLGVESAAGVAGNVAGTLATGGELTLETFTSGAAGSALEHGAGAAGAKLGSSTSSLSLQGLGDGPELPGGDGSSNPSSSPDDSPSTQPASTDDSATSQPNDEDSVGAQAKTGGDTPAAQPNSGDDTPAAQSNSGDETPAGQPNSADDSASTQPASAEPGTDRPSGADASPGTSMPDTDQSASSAPQSQVSPESSPPVDSGNGDGPMPSRGEQTSPSNSATDSANTPVAETGPTTQQNTNPSPDTTADPGSRVDPESAPSRPSTEPEGQDADNSPPDSSRPEPATPGESSPHNGRTEPSGEETAPDSSRTPPQPQPDAPLSADPEGQQTRNPDTPPSPDRDPDTDSGPQQASSQPSVGAGSSMPGTPRTTTGGENSASAATVDPGPTSTAAATATLPPNAAPAAGISGTNSPAGVTPDANQRATPTTEPSAGTTPGNTATPPRGPADTRIPGQPRSSDPRPSRDSTPDPESRGAGPVHIPPRPTEAAGLFSRSRRPRAPLDDSWGIPANQSADDAVRDSAPRIAPVTERPYYANPRFSDPEAAQRYARENRGYLHEAMDIRGRTINHPEIARLSLEEIAIIRHNQFMSLNEHVNRAARDGDLQALEEYDTHIRALVGAYNRLPDYKGVVRRGLTITDPAKLALFESEYVVRNIVTDRGFASSDKVASIGGNIELTIESHHGKDISWATGQQNEVVFPPGHKFYVASRETGEDGTIHIKLIDLGREVNVDDARRIQELLGRSLEERSAEDPRGTGMVGQLLRGTEEEPATPSNPGTREDLAGLGRIGGTEDRAGEGSRPGLAPDHLPGEPVSAASPDFRAPGPDTQAPLWAHQDPNYHRNATRLPDWWPRPNSTTTQEPPVPQLSTTHAPESLPPPTRAPQSQPQQPSWLAPSQPSAQPDGQIPNRQGSYPVDGRSFVDPNSPAPHHRSALDRPLHQNPQQAGPQSASPHSPLHQSNPSRELSPDSPRQVPHRQAPALNAAPPSNGGQMPLPQTPSIGQRPPIGQVPANGHMPPNRQSPPDRHMPPNRQAPADGHTPPNRQAPPDGRTPANRQAPLDGHIPPNRQAPSDGHMPPNRQTPPDGRMPANRQAPPNGYVPTFQQAPPNGYVPTTRQAPPHRHVPANRQAPPNGHIPPNGRTPRSENPARPADPSHHATRAPSASTPTPHNFRTGDIAEPATPQSNRSADPRFHAPETRSAAPNTPLAPAQHQAPSNNVRQAPPQPDSAPTSRDGQLRPPPSNTSPTTAPRTPSHEGAAPRRETVDNQSRSDSPPPQHAPVRTDPPAPRTTDPTRAFRESYRQRTPEGGRVTPVSPSARPDSAPAYRVRRFVGDRSGRSFTVASIRVHVSAGPHIRPETVARLMESVQVTTDRSFNGGHRLVGGDWFLVDVEFTNDPVAADLRVTVDTDTRNPNTWHPDASPENLADQLREQLGLRPAEPGESSLSTDDLRTISNDLTSAETASRFDDPSSGRTVGERHLGPVEDPGYQAAVQDALREGNSFRVGADPRTNPYGQLINDGGTTVPGRNNNCVDCAMSALSAFFGRPQVSAPRWPDRLPNGEIDVASGEQNGLERAARWLGQDLQTDAGSGRPIPDQFRALHDRIAALGPGAAALVVNQWHARDPDTGQLQYHPDGTPVLDGNHASVIVYPPGADGPVWWDPQSGRTSDHPPADVIADSAGLWFTPIPPDSGAADAPTTRDQGSSREPSRPDLRSEPGIPDLPDRARMGVLTDPDHSGNGNGPRHRPHEASGRRPDRDSDPVPELVDPDGRNGLHRSTQDGPATPGRPGVPEAVAGDSRTDTGERRGDRVPAHDDVANPTSAAQRGPTGDQQAVPRTPSDRNDAGNGGVPREVAQRAGRDVAGAGDVRGVEGGASAAAGAGRYQDSDLSRPQRESGRVISADSSPVGHEASLPSSSNQPLGFADSVHPPNHPTTRRVDVDDPSIRRLVDIHREARRGAKVGWRRMGGAIEFNIGDRNGIFAGFSGESNVATNAPVGTKLPPIAPPATTNAVVPAPPPERGFKSNDAENNLLEHLHSLLQESYPLGSDGTSSVFGRMTLFSEQTPCDSCGPTIERFQQMYPNVEIDVVFVTPYPPVARNRPTL
ncbi:toxin glutamine deamidase domain-containing protein [Nocardia cyriacigeorgica]|uniref:toxin glutamine deamidase domain-containing protein n=1 Tax=Nocardia cyriacigeorgica TaxID=135487 RepID=UPI0024928145|nr:toxin glutamine deamidase domain-containing protein [Nocardia cyriacigeorgica]